MRRVSSFSHLLHMNLIKLILIAALIATVIVFFAEGPDLLTIIDQH